MSVSNKTSEIGFYTPLSETLKKRSGGPPDVPIDPVTKKFTPGYIERTVDTQVSDIRGQAAFRDRVDGRELMLVNPYREMPGDTRGSKGGRDKGGRRIRRKTVTAREKRQLKLYDLPKEACRYELFQSLNLMWNEYMEGLLATKQMPGPMGLFVGDGKQRQNMLARLVKADFHGALLEVVRSKCPNFVGIKGIVAQETKNVFKVVTRDDRLVVVPKTKTVFTVEFASGGHCTIYGDQFSFRASERASKKFKPKPTIDIN
ncbi:RNase P/RNase MRP complex subunit [Coemansia erecta]|nr:RNase P/RNase MRP complex subunit [Coemansia erecta]